MAFSRVMRVFHPNSTITPCAILPIDLTGKMALVICLLRQYYQVKGLSGES